MSPARAHVIGAVDFPSALYSSTKSHLLHGGAQPHFEHLDFTERRAM